MMDLYLGDCIEVMKTLDENSIDLTITSPPYDNLRSYNGNNRLWGESVWKDVIKELYRLTKQGGVVVWIVGDATIKGSETGTSFKQALHAIDCGFKLHDTMIWNKGSFTAVGSLKSRYAPVFEYMFIFSKGKPSTFNPIKDRPNKFAGSLTTVTIRQKSGEIKRRPKKRISEFGQRHNVWLMPPEKSKHQKYKHPAIFPEKLIYDHAISWSNKDDVVLDPFMGSGTTGVVCKNLNRNFIGIELDKNYFNIAKDRIEST